MLNNLSGSKSILTALFLICNFVVAVQAASIAPEIYNDLSFRHIGPEGNRVIAIAGVPGDPDIIYAGAASGGIWKSVDGGIAWEPIFDDQDVSSIGSLAVANSHPNIVWAGSGETNLRSSISIGNGVYKSTDSGKTWQHMGLEKTGRIGRLLIHPTNPDIVYVAALGTVYGPQQERGVYRSSNGGKSWKRVLFTDENTGAIDLSMKPDDPETIIAGMWPIRVKTWQRTSGGPNGGMYKTRDGGDNWQKLTKGLPSGILGKIAVDYAPSNPNRVYALIETDQYEYKGVLWQSDDTGDSWELASYEQEYHTRPHYYTRLVVSEDNADEFYSLASSFSKSSDAGRTFSSNGWRTMVGGDNHDLWFDPKDPKRMLLANDGGVHISLNRGKSWHSPDLPVAQMYHVDVDQQVPYFVYGNRQDGPTFRVPSNKTSGGYISSVGGGEAGFTFADPFDNNILWASNEQGVLTRFDIRTGQSVDVQVWPHTPVGQSPADIKYRWVWSYPFILSSHQQNRLYAGSQYVHRTNDGGVTWQVISPDLTLNDKSMQVNSGGLTYDNVGVDYGNTLYALAESPMNSKVIWAGSNDGLVHVSRDDGKNWVNVSKNIRGLPKYGTVTSIDASKYAEGTAYVSIDFHQMDNRKPYIYLTKNFGKSWKKITRGLPENMLSYVHIVREDPKRQGMLYTGTEHSVYFSLDDGNEWLPLRNNLPSVPVRWLTVQEHFDDLVLGTYGRGFWIMDDISPLRNLDKLKSKVQLLKPGLAYRFQQRNLPGNAGDGRRNGGAYDEQPEYGAPINYYLNFAREDGVRISITDRQGNVVTTLNGSGDKGLNRIYWDLRYESSPEIQLRTAPLGYPKAALASFEYKYNEEGWRELEAEGSDSNGPLAAPGQYKVSLQAGEVTALEGLEVRKDPLSPASAEDIEEQVNLALKIRDRVTQLVEMGNTIELLRQQIDDLQHAIENQNQPLYNLSVEMDEKLIAIEKHLYLLHTTGASENLLRFPAQLYSHLQLLSNYVSSGDNRPSPSKYEVYSELSDKLDNHLKAFQQLLNKDLVEFNAALNSSGYGVIAVNPFNPKA